MENNTDRTPHILNASSNLLGLCFIVLTSLKILKLSDATMIDGFTAAATFFFMISSIFSFLSLRTEKKIGIYYEKVADIVFLAGLIFIHHHDADNF